MAADLDSAPCKFPQCDQPAILEVGPNGEESVSLCTEHRRLLVDDPGEFRRLWGAIDPRPEVIDPYTVRWRGNPGPDDTAP